MKKKITVTFTENEAYKLVMALGYLSPKTFIRKSNETITKLNSACPPLHLKRGFSINDKGLVNKKNSKLYSLWSKVARRVINLPPTY